MLFNNFRIIFSFYSREKDRLEYYFSDKILVRFLYLTGSIDISRYFRVIADNTNEQRKEWLAETEKIINAHFPKQF